jgi:hypothetical protein
MDCCGNRLEDPKKEAFTGLKTASTTTVSSSTKVCTGLVAD